MNEERDKYNYGKLVRLTAFIFIPAILVAGLLVYTKLYGIRQALEELVRTQTDGHYSLSIADTELHVRSLSFKFHNVHITRIKADTTRGVEDVRIPAFDLRFGSITSLFTDELDISLLSVREPEIAIRSGHNNIQRSTITRQIIELYPAIEALLARFNIQSLNVARASLHFLQDKGDPFSIRFVDLDIENWRMRELSNRSQLKINIERQNLDLGKANLNFSGISYNYLEHQLSFTDFSVSAADTASGSRIFVSGKALKLRDLDYKDLYNNLRYKLQRAEIVDPVIEAHLRWNKGRKSREINRNIVARMVKQSIGECVLDSAIVTNARVRLELRQANDTVSIDLPKVDFKLHTFAVIHDSSNFQVGDMQVNLNGTALRLPGNWSVRLDEVLYDRHRDLTLRNIQLLNAREPAPVATLSTLRVRYFDLISLIFGQRFSARMIYAEDGTVNLHAGAYGPNDHDSTFRAPETIVHSMSLKNINVKYTNRKQVIDVTGLSFLAANIRTDHERRLRYNLKSVSAGSVVYTDPGRSVRAELERIAFNGEKFNARSVVVHADSLTVNAINFETVLSGPPDKLRGLRHIAADRVSVEGRFPMQRAGTGSAESFSIGRLDLATVRARLDLRAGTLAFDGRNIQTDEVRFGGEMGWPRRLSGEFSSVHVDLQGSRATIGHLRAEYPRRLLATDIHYTGKEYTLSATSALVRRPDHQRQWAAEKISLGDVQLSRGTERILSTDSVTVVSPVLGRSDPQAERVDVYKPVATIPARIQEGRAVDPFSWARVPSRHVYLHPGNITLTDGRKIVFGLVHADRDKRHIRAASLRTALKKSDLLVRNIALESNRIVIDSLLVLPDKTWYSSLAEEETQIDARFRQVVVRGFSLERFLQHRKVNGLAIDLGYTDLDLRRNKLLPDPPPNKKPVTLDGLIPLPDNVNVAAVNIRDGRIQYRQISDRTGEEGYIMMDKLTAASTFDSVSSFISLRARTNLYQSGQVTLDYETLAKERFRLNINVKDMDLTLLNQIIMPLQSLRIRSGYLNEYNLSVHADDDMATGDASISYDGLHLELFKHNEPERKTLGMEVLTLLADGIILKHSKENARTAVNHPRIKHKSVFHYWVTSAIQGATGAIRKGKKKR